MNKKELDKPQESNTIVYTISWNPEKSKRVKRTRGVSFEEIIHAKFLGIHEHPSRNNQWVLAYKYKGYAWAVPFVFETKGIFLKTIYPSRKVKKIYQKRRNNEENETNKTRAVD
ncbi:MAG: toxin [Candidatus Omnitrophica bacterium]|nr:toxin [Candidatus Omnitrophota bacterium]MDD5591702.1 toxin [Candidatus Omnitrophota bacterium]